MWADAANTPYQWLRTGDEFFAAMLAAIESSELAVCLETYAFAAGGPGERIREALVRARQRGARVQVLVDALGSVSLPGHFWDSLRAVGGEVRAFNPLALNRLGIRNHRKLTVCDERVAFVGGFNVAPEYEGDGIQRGWSDIGLRIEGPLVVQLATSFQEMFMRAEFRHKRFVRWRHSGSKKSVTWPKEQILFSGPGRGRSPLRRTLYADLARASEVRVMVAYFLPPRRLRRGLMRVIRHGGRVRLMLAGKSDVLVSQLAGRSLYRRLLKSGIEICEYQPQILHAKLLIVDDAVYIGSSNLDQRSLRINYELMIRLQDPELARQATELFSDRLKYSLAITREGWRGSQNLWRRLKQRWAYFLLVRLDPYIARRQWLSLPD